MYIETDRRCNEGAIEIFNVAFNTLRAKFVLYGPCHCIQREKVMVFCMVKCRILWSGPATAFNSVELDFWGKEWKCFAVP